MFILVSFFSEFISVWNVVKTNSKYHVTLSGFLKNQGHSFFHN